MKGRSKKYYRKIFRAYPDMVTLLQFREMLSGVSDNFARKLIHEKHVKSIKGRCCSYIFIKTCLSSLLSKAAKKSASIISSTLNIRILYLVSRAKMINAHIRIRRLWIIGMRRSTYPSEIYSFLSNSYSEKILSCIFGKA